jgi:putative phage-type endonuclease
MEENRFQSPDELLRVKMGRAVVTENHRMRRGKALEPAARMLYIEVTGNHVRPVCVVHDQFEWFRASLDGLTEDGQLVLEIKCPSANAHKCALSGQIPRYYVAQVQHQLAVTGAPLLHYWSFDPDFDEGPVHALVEIRPDAAYIARLIRREREFWERVKAEERAAREL